MFRPRSSRSSARSLFAPLAFSFLAATGLTATATAAGPELELSSYLGGPSQDTASAVALDAEGNLYVVGTTENPPVGGFPLAFPAGNTFDGGNGRGGDDVLVTKVSPSGQVVYSAILGGPGNDQGLAIAVDAEGRAYVTGNAGPDFPLVEPVEQYQSAPDVFVSVLAASGTELLFSTYLSGANSEFGLDVAVDGVANVYVCGYTDSDENTFIPKTTLDDTANGQTDGFLAKLDYLHFVAPRVVYKTFLGTAQSDRANALALAAGGSVVVGGRSEGDDFDNMPAPQVQAMPGGLLDAFLLKVNATGSGAAFFTWLGGGEDDVLTDVALTPEGEVWATGHTGSKDFPVTPNAAKGIPEDAPNAWFARLNAAGNDLPYSSYWGGFMNDLGGSIVLADDGDVILVGITSSANFEVTGDALQPQSGGFDDVFVSRFTDAGETLVYSTYFGGNSTEGEPGAAFRDGRLAFAGYTFSQGSGGYPTTPNAPQRSAPFTPNGFFTSFLFATGTPDLTLAKSDGGVSVLPGGTVAYELAYANVGTRDATGVVLFETVPEHTTFVPAASAPGWDCQPDLAAGSLCTLDVGDLAVGDDDEATFAVEVDDPFAAGVSEIVNAAAIEDDGSHGDDPTPANNEDLERTPVGAKPPACQLALLAPTAGDKPVRGKKTTIRWSATGECGVSARLELVEPDGDVVLISAAANHLPDPLLSWPVLDTLALGPGYRVRASANGAVAESGEFELVATRDCKLAVTRPNGGETARRGKTFEITWSRSGSTCGQLVDVQVLQSGKVKATLTPLTDNDGAFTWDVPADFPRGRYKVRVRDLSNRSVFDLSDTNFRVK